jgi:hypothetical protein
MPSTAVPGDAERGRLSHQRVTLQDKLPARGIGRAPSSLIGTRRLLDKPARRRKWGPTGLELWGGRLAMTGRVLRPGRAIDDLVCLECILGVSPGMVEAADRIRSV